MLEEQESIQGLELIKLLEKEMHKDVSQIDFPANQENEICIEDIKEWYFEAEKILRVIANITTQPMIQSISQLRYAGHHILKAQVDDADEASKQSNLIEAFKHCKRAVYDALDFYVYKLSEIYKVVLPYLDSQEAIKQETALKEHIKIIETARNQNV